MSVAFKAAWMLLKQRGHELNLPEPVRQNVGPHARNMSPQDLTDARVDAHSNMMGEIDKFRDVDEDGYYPSDREDVGRFSYRNNPIDNAFARLMDRQAENEEMQHILSGAQHHEGEEAYHQGEQGALDRATLAREGQQPEADEMEAMGVPEMSRRLGGRTPPNIGRAGSSDIGEESMSAMDEGAYPYEDLTAFQDYNYRKRRDPVTGDLFNPFPKPLAGRVQDQLAEFADGAGRRAAMSPQPDYSDAKEDEDYGEEMDAKLTPFVGEAPKDGISDSHPEAHNIASTTLRQTPRKQKRGMMDSGQAFKRPGFRGPAMPLPGGKGD